jgi:hypothetical protein
MQRIRDRVKLLTRFIRVAEELNQLGNFHLLQAFISGFSNSAVLRLQWTKARLPKHAELQLAELEKLMAMNSSFKNYRLRLAATNPPAIPYMCVIDCRTDRSFPFLRYSFVCLFVWLFVCVCYYLCSCIRPLILTHSV